MSQPTDDIRRIAIEGAIGVGKTSLAKRLAERTGARLALEDFAANPFLEAFYKDPKKYAFQTQMFFLVNRYKQHERLRAEDLFSQRLVSDYSFEKDRIFAYLNLESEELKLYESIYPLLYKNVPKPDLVVFLHSDVDRLLANIKKRGREMEAGMTREYLQKLNEAYHRFYFNYDAAPCLIVNSTEIDFVENDADFEAIHDAVFRKDRGYKEFIQPESSMRLDF